MKLNDKDRETTLAIFLVLLSIYCVYLSATIKTKSGTEFILSAAMVPLLLSSIFLLLSLGYLISTIRKGGRPTFNKFFNSFKGIVTEQENLQILKAILLVAVFIFVLIPNFNFYICGAFFLLAIQLLYVRRIGPIRSILYSVVIAVIMFLIFTRGFSLPI